MKKNLSFLIFIVVLFININGDWKKDIKDNFSAWKDYQKIITIIGKNLSENKILKSELPTALIYGAYCCKKKEKSILEKNYIKRFFKISKDKRKIEKNILPLEEYISTLEYLSNWEKEYPKITNIEIITKNIKKFSAPKTIEFLVKTLTENGEFQIVINGDSKFTKIINTRENKFSLPLKYIDLRKDLVKINFELTNREITSEEKYILLIKYKYPSEKIEYDKNSGTVSLKGKEFKKEKYSKTTIIRKTKFDRKYFLKKALPKIIIGGISIIAGSSFANSSDKNEYSPGKKEFYYSTGRTFKAFGVGISILSLIKTMKSFKRETYNKIEVIEDPSAKTYNQYLKKIIEKIKNNIYIEFELKKFGSKK